MHDRSDDFQKSGPGSSLGTSRFGPKEPYFEKALDHMAHVLKELGNPAIAGFGGNDTSEVISHLLKRDKSLRGGHGIKTVDDDLPVTELSPGALTTLIFNAYAIINTFSDFSSYGVKGNVMGLDGSIIPGEYRTCPVMIYQVMGRKSGKLTQGTGIAKIDSAGYLDPTRPPHIIISKETPLDKEVFFSCLEEVLRKQGKAVIVVQEDIDDAATAKSLAELDAEYRLQNASHLQTTLDQLDNLEGGTDIKQKIEQLLGGQGNLPKTDASGNIQHGRVNSFSTGRYIAKLVSQEFKINSFYGNIKEVAIVPQHLQRAAYKQVEKDKEYAYDVGRRLGLELATGNSGFSVVLKLEDGKLVTGITDIENIAGKAVNVNPNEILDRYRGPTQEFVDRYLGFLGSRSIVPQYTKPTMRGIELPQSITGRLFAPPN